MAAAGCVNSGPSPRIEFTKHLDQLGVAERVTGSKLAEYGKIPA